MLLLPEQKLKSVIDFFLENVNDSYLHECYGGMTFGDGSYSYFENASALFLKRNDHPRQVTCNMFFNQERQGLPTIHIALNQDYPGEGNGLGFDSTEGIFEDEYRESKSRVYSARYNIICTSDQVFEVLLMYNTLKAFLQGNVEILELNGLQNVKFSGQDLILTDYLMPPNIYARGFVIDCLYEFTAPSIMEVPSIRDMFLHAHCGRDLQMVE